MISNDHNINILKDLITKSVNLQMQSTSDFAFLSGSIQERTHESIGVNTLKRLWGFYAIAVTPRESTLNILARYVGFRNWEDFVQYHSTPEQNDASHIVLSNHISSRSLSTGDKIRIAWNPGRVCLLEYLGLETFRVLESENSKLKPGNTFHASLFVEGQPLLMDYLVQESSAAALYVAGSNGGLTQVELL
ncbi:MAG: hypothetical protein MJZ51_06830 [Bacteroidales bacterium]|nr:hypothetical protein [Bacteroidales bacterium]